ncbi:hypothetical protein S245_038014 [Arachis hypogaea]
MLPLSFVCARLLASHRASAEECSRLRAVLLSFCNVSSSSVITAPNLTVRLLTKIASVVLYLYSPQLLGSLAAPPSTSDECSSCALCVVVIARRLWVLLAALLDYAAATTINR